MRAPLLLLACVLHGPAMASPSPRFEGLGPELDALAAVAWKAGLECAGRPARTASLVRLEVGDVDGAYAGKAHRTQANGLLRITLAIDNVGPVPLFHEMAHAWAYGGPATLDEGLATVLADCMLRVAALPLDEPPFPAHRGALEGMVPLRSWDNSPWASPEDRKLGYRAATAFFKSLITEVPLEALVPSEPWRSWDDFDRAAEGFPRGARPILRVLDLSATQQAKLLGDHDGDGIVDLAEPSLGLDPRRLDTDGDGLWDGLDAHELPKGAMVLTDDDWHCSGDRQATAKWRVGTPYRTHDSVAAMSLRGSDGLVVRFEPERFDTDAMWVHPAPGARIGSRRCRELDGLVVYTLEPRWGSHLDEIARLMLETNSGPSVIQLGGSGPSTATRMVLPDAVLAQALEQGDLGRLTVVAEQSPTRATAEVPADDGEVLIPGQAFRFRFDGQPRCSGFHAAPGSPVSWYGGDQESWGEVVTEPVTPDGVLVRARRAGVDQGWLVAEGPAVQTSLRCLGVGGYTIYGPTDDHVGTMALLATRLEPLRLSRRPTILLGQAQSGGDGAMVSLTDAEVEELLAADTAEPLRKRLEDLMEGGS